MRDWIWAAGIAASWVLAIWFFAVLSGCTNPPEQRTYTDGASKWNFEVMVQCGTIIARAPFVLTDAEKNWHYQRCLRLNGATI